MAINEDGTLNPEKLRQYYTEKLENDGKFWEWLIESQRRALATLDES